MKRLPPPPPDDWDAKLHPKLDIVDFIILGLVGSTILIPAGIVAVFFLKKFF